MQTREERLVGWFSVMEDAPDFWRFRCRSPRSPPTEIADANRFCVLPVSCSVTTGTGKDSGMSGVGSLSVMGGVGGSLMSETGMLCSEAPGGIGVPPPRSSMMSPVTMTSMSR